MDAFLFSLLLAAQVAPQNGNLITEPQLLDYVSATRIPGIMGKPEDVIDHRGNPAKSE